MSIQVRVRRDTLTNLNSVTPADGEIAYNTTDDRLHMGDGATTGGIPHLNFRDDLKSYFNYTTTGGSANAYTLTLPYAPPSYTAGLRIKFKASFTNTGAATINVNSLGAKSLKIVVDGALTAVGSGDIINGMIYMAVYDGTDFQVIGGIESSGTPPGSELLGTATASGSAALNFPSMMTPEFNLFMCELADLRPATDAVKLYLRTSTDNGSSYDSGASDYKQASREFFSTSWNTASIGDGLRNNAVAQYQILNESIGNAAAEGVNARIFFYSPFGTARPKFMEAYGNGVNQAGAYGVFKSWGVRASTADIDAFSVFFSSGNITSGTGRLYGFRV